MTPRTGPFATPATPPTPVVPAADPAARLLAIVDAVARELKPGVARAPAGLESSLDRDLGLDSLARAELASRIEAAFAVRLPDETFATAERPLDLLEALLRAEGPAAARAAVDAGPAPGPAPAALAAPESIRTLGEALAWHAERNGPRAHLRFYEDDADGEVLTYQALHDRARAVAAGLQAAGVEPGQTVAILLPTGPDYFAAFFGALHAGAIAVPIYPPARSSRLPQHLQRQRGIFTNAQARVLIGSAEVTPLAAELRAGVPSLQRVATVDELADAGGTLHAATVDPQDVALLQYTSGSTGAPKGVTLSHANLLANIRAMAAALRVRPDDVFVSWLPLYHDMGLIGAWLGSLLQGTPLVIFPPLTFLARPTRWLDAVHRWRGTLSGGPNFAYELLLRHTSDEMLERLDLGCWRVAFNGAEPVAASTVERFCDRFAAAGFRREAMTPVYGLAENCVGLGFPPPGRGPRIDRIRRDDLARLRRAVPASAEEAASTAQAVVACGRPLPGHDVRIVDDAGFELPERHEGRLQFCGPSATRGYWRNDEATRALLDGDWRNSGDLAYLADGEIFVTARAKDLIIRAGRNIHPADVEDAVGALPGLQPGRVVAFADPDPGSGSERLIVLAETRQREPDARERLRREINDAVAALLGSPPDDVVLAPPNTIPRTSSGKVRRAATRDVWRAGGVGQAPPPLPVVRGTLAGLRARLRRARATAAALLFATRAWTSVVALAPFGWLAALVLPTQAWRWQGMRLTTRLLFRAAGVPLTVDGLENLPAAPGVLVANHSSYLDVLALVAALPRPVAFVAKAELQAAWYVRLPLQRIGTCFVERFDRRQGLQDYRRVAAVAREGRSPLFFPEGTFRRAPGLMPFRMGAFACAIDAGLPIVPLAIVGTRQILVSGSWFPRPGAVAVRIAAPIPAEPPEGGGNGARWASALALRDRTRAVILGLSGEPDAADADLFAPTPG